MEARHEIIPFDQASPIRLFMHKLGDVSRHWHESLELLFVLAGEVTVLTGDRENVLQTEDLLLVNSNVIHELHSQGCVLIAVQIKLSKFDLPQSTLEQLYFHCNSLTESHPEHFDRLKQIITSMLRMDAAQDTTLFRSRALAYELLGELVQNFKAEKPLAETNTHRHLERLNKILRYIADHCHEQLTLSQLAEQEHLSTPYLSSFFEKYMGVNFTTYYTGLRLERAMHDLLYTDLTVEQVALKNGFSDPRAYVRAFKKHYAMLPSQYRRSSGSGDIRTALDPLLSINYLDFKPETYFHVLSKYLPAQQSSAVAPAPGKTPVQALPPIAVDAAGPGTPLRHSWRNFIGVARAKDLLYSDVQQMLRQLQQQVGFRYLRFHGIFSDDMLVCQRTRDGQLQFNFTLTDKVLDFILSLGLKPLIQFSFMPGALAQDASHTVFANPVVISMPARMEEWNTLVRQFLTHLRSRYGQQELRRWLYSVWNEPDTSTTMFGFSRKEDFFLLYQNTWRTVKDFDPELVFGTPSLFPTTEESYLWFGDYLHFAREAGCLPQFVDVHYYSDIFQNVPVQAASFSTPARFNADPDHFSKFIDRLTAFLQQQHLAMLPLYITEWNLTVSHRNLINDTCFKATHLVKNFLENYDRADAVGYWSVTDFLDELFPDAQLFHGGMGLFTRDGIPKPSFHAMCMMAKLGDRLLSAGPGYFATCRDNGDLAILLYNYEHCNPLFVEEGLGLTQTDREGVFPHNAPAEVFLTVENLSCEGLRIRSTLLNREHGSCFDQWVRMGAQPLGSEETAWLRDTCRPQLQVETAEAVFGTLRRSILLAPHEIRLLEITPA